MKIVYEFGDVVRFLGGESPEFWNSESAKTGDKIIVREDRGNTILTFSGHLLPSDTVEYVEHLAKDDVYAAANEHWLSKIPEEFRSWVSGYAYDQGHAGGHDEVLSYLIEIVDGLRPAIDAFRERVANGG